MTTSTEPQVKMARHINEPRTLSRRNFLLTLGALSGGAALLAACGGTSAIATVAPAASAAPSIAPTTGATASPSTATSGAAASPTIAAAATASRAASATAPGTAQDATPQLVAAANAFLATLDSTQQASVQFAWSNTAQKQRWSNLPEGLYTRAGLMWGNLNDAQRNAWLAIMQATLSTEGYNRVIAEWNADDALATQERSGTATIGIASGTATTGSASGTAPARGTGGPQGGMGGTPPTGGTGGPGGGGGLLYGKQYYWVALIGAPSATSAWQWQWGGHHVTVNATVVGSNIALTPSFIGAQPATYTDSSGKTIRPLGDIADEAFALVASLDTTQQKAAVLGNTSIDLVLGPGQDGKTIQAEGLPGAQMTATQQAALVTLIGHYTGLLNDEDAAARLTEIKAGLAQTYLAWYGPTTTGSAAYFRIAGPTVVIEYSPQSMGGNAANHIHGIYRDPTNDYGAKYAE